MALRNCNEEELEKLLELFKALAHPIRIRIAKMLCARPRYSYEIEEEFDCERTNITKHISIMRDSELIKAYKEGRKTLFVLQTAYIQEILVDCVDGEMYEITKSSKS